MKKPVRSLRGIDEEHWVEIKVAAVQADLTIAEFLEQAGLEKIARNGGATKEG